MAVKSFFTGILLKTLNSPNKMIFHNSFRAPLVQTTIMTLRSRAADAVKNLNIPEKPKKPMTPYMKFIHLSRPNILKQHPHIKATEIVKMCASEWKKLGEEEKQKYVEMYKEECEQYDRDLLNYTKSLTEEQKEALNTVELEKKASKKKRKLRKLCRETNKPKRPPVPYMMYLMEQSKMRNLPIKQLMSSVSDEWANLPEANKKKYVDQYSNEKEKYEEALNAWETKMLEEGHTELVRTKTLQRSSLRSHSITDNKPKRPHSPFMLYLIEQSNLRDIPIKQLQTEAKEEWEILSATEKKKYQQMHEIEKEKYEVELKDWEDKMIKAGHTEFVRAKSVPPKQIPRIKVVKNVKPQ